MYQALYRKYRPQTFDEVVGQNGVTQTLKAQLKSGRLSHAYLFTGSRGTGKTSCAKILAKAVNCLNPVDGNPCNCCEACRRIDSGNCMDVLEIDAASNNGVDNVRDLRDGAVYAPAEVKKRVFIIDEVHMLSIAAFNALLKIIEEPPEHVLFILATTELHKVPATILSRCQRFSFRRLLPEDIAARLNYAAYQEEIDLTADAASLLSRLADGALRDGMSLLDQVATSVSGKTVDAAAVYECLGVAGSQKTAEMLHAIADKNSEKVLMLFSDLYLAGKDVPALLNELCSLCRDLLVLKTAGKSGESMLAGTCTDEERNALLPRFTAAELLRIVSVLQETHAGLSRNSAGRIDAELCLMRLCAPELNLDPMAMDARLSALEEKIASGNLIPAGYVPAESRTAEFAPEPEALNAPPEKAELPVGFLPELTEKLSKVLDPADYSLFEVPLFSPELKGNVLLLKADTEWVKNRIDTPEKIRIISEKASAILRWNVRAEIVVSAAGNAAENRVPKLLEVGLSHPELFEIK